MVTHSPVAPSTFTLEQVNTGLTEINAMDDDTISPMKEPARTLLADLLGHDIPTRPLSKTEFLDLLDHAEHVLRQEKP